MKAQGWDDIWQDEDKRRRWGEPDAYVVSLLPKLESEGVARALDLGCGVGRHARLLATAGIAVTAQDSSPSGLDHCRTWFETEGLRGDYVLDDMRTLAYPDDYYDLVIAWNVIYHTDRSTMVAVLNEIRRVTRPDGLLCLTLISTRNSNYGKGVEVEPKTFDNPKKSDGAHLHHYADEAEVRDLLRNWEVEDLVDEEQTFEGKRHPNTWHWIALARKRA
ncbi:MAG: methyltransferase domain-containing protein [Phycisphaerae bacterium]|nr:methyltransferase domain-containing protein [Phycisphaerae bacterium]